MVERDTSEDDAKQWTGYKKATLIVSIVSVLIIIVQGVYDRKHTERWKQIEYLRADLDRAQADLAKDQSAPRLELRINTLEQAGVSSRLLSGLTAFPSTVEIRNTGGGTAKGLRIDLNSSERITQFQKWPALDPISITRTDSQGKALRIEASQMEKGSSVGLTLLTTKLPKIQSQYVLDVGGDLIPTAEHPPAESKPDYLRLISSLPRELSFEERYGLAKELENETNPLKIRVRALEKHIEYLRSRTWWDVVSSSDLKYVWWVPFLAPSVWLVVRSLKKDRRKRSRGRSTLADINSKRLRVRTLAEVLREFGTPDMLASSPADDARLELVYFSKYDWLPDSRGLRFHFQNLDIVKIEDEGGHPILETKSPIV